MRLVKKNFSSWSSRAGGVAKVWVALLGVVALAGTLLFASSAVASVTGHHSTVATQAGQQFAMPKMPATTPTSMPATAPPSMSGTMGATTPTTVPGGMPATMPATAPPSMSGSMRAMTSAPMPTAMAPTGSASTGSTVSSMGSNTSGICTNVVGATSMPDGMLMAPVPSGPPTAAQQAAANQLVAQTTAGIQKYASLSAAEAAGYTVLTNPKARMVHYANWNVVKSGDVLDPSNPSSLMYANTVSGPVLVGAMYLGPGMCQPGPDVGGSLTQWHAHTNLCLSSQHQVVGNTSQSGSCSSGQHNTDTYFMLHVWTAPSLAAQFQFQADLPTSALTPIIRSGQA
ncbi:MAG TPA: hypothetical protein VMU77_03105 [Acidimicrobiales bacterium]|nr:hypothetical protein [Acidimicrobiales bacterium]